MEFLILLALLLSSCSTVGPVETETIYVTDTVYIDTLYIKETIIVKDTVYSDKDRTYNQTLYDNGTFTYIKANGVYTVPVQYLDYNYNISPGYYYMTNSKYQIVSK